MMLSMVFAMITISLASAHRIAEVLEEKTDIANPTGRGNDRQGRLHPL